MNADLMTRAANNIRVLITQMVETAKSGHPGGSMGGADFVNVLYSSFLKYDPEQPTWIARDRFFLDPGHMSPMLYSVLALSGFYTIDELKQFRQWGSVTPGHPELDPARGVENGSGPLGQGHVMAVGCAIAERFMQARFGDIVAHKTYAFISDGGIQEEISQGAGRIAGTLGLHNLIMFYDANEVQLSTRVEEVTSEDTAAKYRAWGWNVLEIDATDPAAIAGAITTAHEEKERPTIIIGHTIMARGVVKADGTTLEGAVSTHGQPLSKAGADIAATITNLGGNPEKPWEVWPEVKKLYSERREHLKELCRRYHDEEKKWAKENPELAQTLSNWIEGKMPELQWDAIALKAGMATRNASATVLGYLAEHLGNMIVSSADLANSDKTDGFLKKTHAILKNDFSGAFLHAGVAELTMASIMNGIALHGGLIAACGTFFVFSDYMKPAIRMSALMELPVKYLYSHDAFRVGEDGPTHQPVEHESQIRLLEQMDNLSGKMSAQVWRPCDSAETVQCYRMAMANTESPTIMIFSRQDLVDIPETLSLAAAGVPHGGYILMDAENPDIVMVANGSEVSLACAVAAKLEEQDIHARIVSMPGVGLFARQSEEYKKSVLGENVPIFALTAGLPSVFYPVMRGTWHVEGLQRFGSSAPYKVLDEKFGFTPDKMLKKVENFLKK